MANYLIPSQVIVFFEKEHGYLIYFKIYIILNHNISEEITMQLPVSFVLIKTSTSSSSS